MEVKWGSVEVIWGKCGGDVVMCGGGGEVRKCGGDMGEVWR